MSASRLIASHDRVIVFHRTNQSVVEWTLSIYSRRKVYEYASRFNEIATVTVCSQPSCFGSTGAMYSFSHESPSRHCQ